MTPLERVNAIYADVHAISAALSLLSWDRQVLMPAGGGSARTQHSERLMRLRRSLLLGDELGKALDDLECLAPADSPEAATVRVLRREISESQRIPLDLAIARSRVSSEAYEVWKQAKATNDFPLLAPYLEQLFDIARSVALALGTNDHIYDPLIDTFEEGATYRSARAMFDTISGPISKLVAEIQDRGTPTQESRLTGDWDAHTLRSVAEEITERVGFDYSRGRLDLCANAFTNTMDRTDVRLTTRASDHVRGVLSSSLHEMGHGLYEQGMPVSTESSALSGGISLAVHESQSRLWENIVGRSLGFWECFFPLLATAVPSLADLGPREFWRAYSAVCPTEIRVGSDELTYNLHILVRFELEVEILTRSLEVSDLAEAWNAKYRKYLGFTPSSDSVGVLQDVHWSRGTIGYFPTYAVGNMIGGQLWAVMCRDLVDIEGLMSSGDFGPILGWLSERIYQKGKLFTPSELIQQVTGKPLDASDWLDYVSRKYSAIYDL